QQHAAGRQMDRLAIQQDAMLRAVPGQGHRVPEALHGFAPVAAAGSEAAAWRARANAVGHGSPPPAAPITSLPPNNNPPKPWPRPFAEISIFAEGSRSGPLTRTGTANAVPPICALGRICSAMVS